MHKSYRDFDSSKTKQPITFGVLHQIKQLITSVGLYPPNVLLELYIYFVNSF